MPIGISRNRVVIVVDNKKINSSPGRKSWGAIILCQHRKVYIEKRITTQKTLISLHLISELSYIKLQQTRPIEEVIFCKNLYPL